MTLKFKKIARKVAKNTSMAERPSTKMLLSLITSWIDMKF